MLSINSKNEIEITCTEDDIRINKFLAMHDICSRRDADQLINSGKVKINLASKHNNVFANALPGQKLQIGDKVKIAINRDHYRYLVWDRGQEPTLSSAPLSTEGAPAIIDLDKESDGLVFYTNDTTLKKKVEASTRLEYEYIVKTKEPATTFTLNKLLHDISYEGHSYRAAKSVRIMTNNVINPKPNGPDSGSTISLVLRQYQSHIVKRLLNAIHLNVIHVRRVRIGNLKSSDFRSPSAVTLTPEQLEAFKKCL